MQLNIGHLNEEGVYQTGQYTTFALTGAVRGQVWTKDACRERSEISLTPQKRPVVRGTEQNIADDELL